ncbi:YbaB/EbfC family nucleoid-associated protein [Mycolicibacterium lutetiense]
MSEDLSGAQLRAFMTRYAQQCATSAPPQQRVLASVKAEAYSPGESVWACADGQGFIEALMIDDAAIVASTVEELEDLISDAMLDASARGQSAGTEALRAVRSPATSAGLKSRNGKGITGV